MNSRELLDAFVSLGMGTFEVDGDEKTYWFATRNGNVAQGDIVTVQADLMKFLDCEEIGLYIKDDADEDDSDKIMIRFKDGVEKECGKG